jgi:hypothetical protein
MSCHQPGLMKNNSSATIIVTLTEEKTSHINIFLYFYSLLSLLWALNLTISTEFPYLGGVVGGQFS